MKKRIVCVITALVMLCTLTVFANANSFTMSITDAEKYKSDNLSGNNLLFSASSEGVFSISGDVLKTFYYDPQIKYYTFSNGTLTVCADKNSLYGFDISRADFEIKYNGLSVNLIHKDGSKDSVTDTAIQNTYTVKNSGASKYSVAWFGSEYAPSAKAGNGEVIFYSKKLGAFTIADFQFSDVSDKSKWYYEYVNLSAARGILSGMGNNTYRPESNITRAQLAAIVVKSTEHVISYHASDKKKFADVSRSSWYYDYVTKCATLGIMDGVGGGNFRPEASASREQIAAVAMRVLNIIGSYGGKPLPAIDAGSCYSALAAKYEDAGSIQSWAYVPAEFCSQLEIMVGHGGKFRPSANVTRAECAKIFYLIYNNIFY